MLRIHVKMGPPRNKEWTCCFGLHVHTATIIIGLWHLFLNILALSLLAVIIRNPEMMHELESSYDDQVDHDAPALPTPLSKIDPPYAYRDHSLNYQNMDMGGLVCICMIAITLMMIYGAVKGKPSHLLPFFCLQLFDFAITTLTAAGYLCYLQSVHRLIAESHRLPWREKLLQLSPDALVMVVLIAFIGSVLLKAYAIGIVWRCYKYLTMRQHNIRSMLPYIIPHVAASTHQHSQERDYSTLLPDYDEAIAQSLKQPPPPSYHVAISNMQMGALTETPLPGEINDTENNNNNLNINNNDINGNNNDRNTTEGESTIRSNTASDTDVPILNTIASDEAQLPSIPPSYVEASAGNSPASNSNLLRSINNNSPGKTINATNDESSA